MDSLNSKKLKTAIKYIDTWLDTNFRNSKFPGMQVAIMHNDQIVYSNAFGFADLKNKVKLNTKNTFRIASHSKTFTATAIMMLYEAGKLNLDDEVNKHLDWFKSSKDKRVANVTIRQLLNHTSGIIRDGVDSDFWQLLREFPDKKELQEYISNCQLIYNGDVRFKYSNYGYGYLGLVIEAVGGMPYRDYVTRNIIERLNLKSTLPDLDAGNQDMLVKGYGLELFNREKRQFKHVDTHALSPATGLCSNAEDLCSFLHRIFTVTIGY